MMTISFNKPIIIFILGYPGSGKGTYCRKLIEQYACFTYVGVGDLLRKEVEDGTENSELIKACILEGKLVPAELSTRIIAKTVDTTNTNLKIVIDGYPRDQKNFEAWNKDPISANTQLLFVLLLDCPPIVCTERCIQRDTNKQRIDDTRVTIRKRIEHFDIETKPLIEYFKKHGLLRIVNTNRNIDEAYEDIVDVLKSYNLLC